MHQRSSVLKSRLPLAVKLSLGALLLSSCVYSEPIEVKSENLRIEFDIRFYSRIVSIDPTSGASKALSSFSPTETVMIEGEEQRDFMIESQQWTEISDSIGEGQRLLLEGKNSLLRKQVSVTTYSSFPNTALFHVTYTNLSDNPLTLESWTNNHYQFNADGDSEPGFWSFQGGSYESRPDWVLPVEPGFSQQNFQGMNASDYGGGVPVSDVWRKDIGIGVGHLALTPKQVSLPVERPDSTHVTLGVVGQIDRTLDPGESYSTLGTFVHLHDGDFFETLST